jgi:CRP-like cAMP-binding protein
VGCLSIDVAIREAEFMEALIRKLESFGPMADGDKAFLRGLGLRERTFDSRTDIISEGEEPSDVHLIIDGFACRYKLLDEDKRQIVAYLLPGDFCDLHVFILKAMDHNIATLSPCKVIDIPRATILELLERPSLARLLLMATLVDEATLREWIANVGQRQAEERIAHFFCEIHARLEVVGLSKGGDVQLPITQLELADTVGLSTVHLNRSLQSLRQEGLIAFNRGMLHIPNVAKLRTMSGFTSNYLHLMKNAGISDQAVS